MKTVMKTLLIISWSTLVLSVIAKPAVSQESSIERILKIEQHHAFKTVLIQTDALVYTTN